MTDNSKRRYKKDKSVERTCNDLDDENLRDVQVKQETMNFTEQRHPGGKLVLKRNAVPHKFAWTNNTVNIQHSQDASLPNIKQEIIDEVDEDLDPSIASNSNSMTDGSIVIKKEADEIEPNAVPPVAFSINVVVEEYNENDKKNVTYKIVTTQNSCYNVKPISPEETYEFEPINQTVLSDRLVILAPKAIERKEVVVIDLDEMYKEVDKIVRTSDNIADAVLAVELKNSWGMVLKPSLKEDPRDAKLQRAINKWKTWNNGSRYRDVPLLYKCYICDIAWWHLEPFRSHLKGHPIELYNIEIEEHPHEANLMAYGAVIIPSAKDIYAEGECWKCNKPFDDHTLTKRLNGVYYQCKCCEIRFQTCTDLRTHEGVCWQYLKYLEIEKDHKMLMCNLCKNMFVSSSDLAKHMITRHSVRSDVPIPSQYRICAKCNLKYFIHTLHCCPKKTMNNDCVFCFKSFSSKLTVDLHTVNTESNVLCKICNYKLDKKCMEMSHYTRHTENFDFAYKCAHCTDMKVYMNEKAMIEHRWIVHKRRPDKRRHNFEKVLIPGSYFGVPLKKGKVLERQQKQLEERKKITPDPGLHKMVTPNPRREEDTRIIRKFPDDSEDNVSLQVKKTALQRKYHSKTSSNKVVNHNDVAKVSPAETLVIDIKKEAEILEQNAEYISPEQKENTHEETAHVEEPHCFHTAIKSEPNDEEYEEDIIRLSMDGMPQNMQIKEEPQQLIVKTEPEELEDVIFEIQEDTEEPLGVVIKTENYSSDDDNFTPIDPEVFFKRRAPRIYSCRKCGYKNVHRKYKEHISGNCKKPGNGSARYPCTMCRRKYSSFMKYLQHFAIHGYKPMSCPICKSPHKYMAQLLPHVMGHVRQSFVKIHVIDQDVDSAKRSSGRYQCKFCKDQVDYNHLCLHWVKHHKTYKRDEGYYDKKVENVSLGSDKLNIVIAHLLSHSPALRICIICERHFERKNDCKRHLIEHLLSDAYQKKHEFGGLSCQICNDLYQKADQYKLHMRNHGSLPVYKCEICDRAFSDSSNFTKHKKLHNLQAYVCDLCSKKFQAKLSLIKHLDMHQCSKIIECDMCARTYYTQSAYKKHYRIYHDKHSTKFRCVICGERFVTLKEKWDHMWLLHQERKFQADCPICKKGFRKSRDLNNHLKFDHGKLERTPNRSRRHNRGEPSNDSCRLVNDNAETVDECDLN